MGSKWLQKDIQKKLNRVPLTGMQKAIFRLGIENTLKKRLISISKGHLKPQTVWHPHITHVAWQPAYSFKGTSGQMHAAVRMNRNTDYLPASSSYSIGQL